MNIENFHMTFDQFAALIESDPNLVEHWDDTRGREAGVSMRDDVESYITEYMGEKHGDEQEIMYWLLVEMNVIEPDREVDPLVQKFVDTPA